MQSFGLIIPILFFEAGNFNNGIDFIHKIMQQVLRMTCFFSEFNRMLFALNMKFIYSNCILVKSDVERFHMHSKSYL